MSQQTLLTRLTAGEVSASMEEFIDRLNDVASDPDVYQGSPTNQRAALRDARNQLIFFDGGVYLINNLGTLVATEPDDQSLVGEDWSGHSFFQNIVRSPALYISNIEPEGPNQEQVVTIAVPVLGESGEFNGLVAGMFRLNPTAINALYGNLIKLRIGQGGSAYLVDGNEYVLFASDKNEIGKSFAEHPIASEALNGEVGAMRALSQDGQNMWPGTHPCGEPNGHWWSSRIGPRYRSCRGR